MTANDLLLLVMIALVAFVAGWGLHVCLARRRGGQQRDPLTELADRRAFDGQMAQRIAEFERYGKVFSLLLLDADHFKELNDTYGHQAGDTVLRRLADVLRRMVRQSDIVARYGGEEFAVILPETPIDGARQSSERIRKAVERESVSVGKADLNITVSIGAAEVMPGESVSQLIERADGALYASKDAGRNCTHWHDGGEIRQL